MLPNFTQRLASEFIAIQFCSKTIERAGPYSASMDETVMRCKFPAQSRMSTATFRSITRHLAVKVATKTTLLISRKEAVLHKLLLSMFVD